MSTSLCSTLAFPMTLPMELQHVQAPEGFVGRLAFADPEGYEAYVDKVLRRERGPGATRREPEALFYSVHDGTAATRIGHRGLIEPVAEMAEGMRAAGRFKASSIRSVGDLDDPFPDELMRKAAARSHSFAAAIAAPRITSYSPSVS